MNGFKELLFALLSLFYIFIGFTKANNDIPNELIIATLFLILAEIYSLQQK